MKVRNLRRSASAVSILAVAAGSVEAQQLPAAAEEAPVEIEEIVITGSYIRGIRQADKPTPISVVDRDDFLEIGALDIADLTQTLTSNNGAQNNPDAFTQNLSTGTESINLRGLGLASTLVLLNGRRQVFASSPTDDGILFTDTASLVPTIALERVEILKDGAATLYGSDAVAGVVNFITRSDFNGFEFQADFQGNTQESQNDVKLQGLWGIGDRRTHFTAGLSYLHRTALTTRERDLRPDGFRVPDSLSISTLASFPGNFIPLTAPNPALNPATGPLANLFNAGFDNAVPLFNFPVIGPVAGTPVVPSPLGGFLVGSFAGFQQQSPALLDPNNPASILAPADGVADAFTGIVLQQLLAQSPGLIDPALAGFDINALSPEQMAALGQAFLDLNAAQAAAGFGTLLVPDPGCEAVAAIDDDVVPNISQVPDPLTGQPVDVGACQFDFGRFFNLVPRDRRIQGYADFRHEFTEALSFYGEFAFARNRARRDNSNFPITTPLALLPNNPFNPFTGAASLFIGRSPGRGQIDNFFTDHPNKSEHDNDTFRFVAGFRGDFLKSWYYDVSFTRAFNNFDFNVTDGLAQQTQLALAGLGGPGCDPATGQPGVGPCMFYNPFATGVIGDPDARVPVFDLAGNLTTDSQGNPVTVPLVNSREILDFIIGDLTLDGESDLKVVDAVVAGDLFDLPAGPLSIAIGGQFRDEDLKHDFDDNTNAGNFLFVSAPIRDFRASREVFAFFGEMRIPVLKEFEINFALRYENFEGIDDTVDPKVAVLFTPADWFALRGSYSTSFRAPSVFQSFGNQTTLNSVIDPRDPTSQPFIPIVTDGNEDLEPENSRTFNAGITLTPVGGLEINFDWWSFRFRDVIIQEQAEEVARRALIPDDPDFDPSLLADGIVRLGPTGALTFVRTQFTNAAFIKTDGFDASARYRLDTDIGTFRAGIESTYVNKYVAPVGPGRTALDVAGLRNSQNFTSPIPEWRFNADVGYAYGGHNFVTFFRFTDSFRDDQNCGGGDSPSDFVGSDPVFLTCPDGLDFAKIDEHLTVDMQYSYSFGPMGPLEGATLTVGAINLFDNNPPFVNTDGAFESRTHDPRGRMAYVRLSARF